MATKMSADLVGDMRRKYGEGWTQGALAKHFRIGIAQVGRIVRGEAWMAGAGNRDQTPAEQERMLARLMAVQEEVLEKQRLEAIGMTLDEQPKRVIPPSPLEEEGEGETPEAAEEPTGLTALQKRAASFGMDIEKLLIKPEEK